MIQPVAKEQSVLPVSLDEDQIEEPVIYLAEPPEDKLQDVEVPQTFAISRSMRPTHNTWQQALVFAQQQHSKPTSDWFEMCQNFCRSAFGENPYYGSAYAQWLNAPADHKHVGGDPDQAPVGSLLCFKGAGPYGHIMLAAREFRNGTQAAWSNDLVRRGGIDKVARTAPVTEWGQKYLGYIWTVNRAEIELPDTEPVRHRPLVHLRAILAAAHRDPRGRQGHQTAPAQVKRVELALHREGLLAERWSKDGSFGSSTIKAYADWQRRLGYSGKDADGIPGLSSLQKLGHKHGFAVAH